ncbi:MAG: hypothetical protein ACRENJ_04935, partial [Candidatus Eiseniibacteriota bacterium]
MREQIRTAPPRVAALAVVLALAGTTCSFPTDKSDEVFVTVELPSPVVLRGEKLDAYARVWQRIGPDSAEILNVDFDWSTDNDAIATVKEGGFGSAEITGVNSGTVGISARAVAFEKAQNAYVTVRVANPLEVDDVQPDTIRFGGKVTISGVGVRNIFLASLGAGVLFPDTFSHRGDPQGLDTMEFWVPPPSHSDVLVVFGPGVFFATAESTYVRPFDIYELNQTAPSMLDLDGPRPIPRLPVLLFFNPALAFELLPRDVKQGADWYRFSQSTARDVTLILNSAEVRGTFSTFLTDSLYWDPGVQDYFIGPDSWTIGPSSHACHGYGFAPAEAQAESTIVALRNYPDTALHAIAIYSQPGPYGLTVIDGYVVTDPARFPVDSHEEDDFCNAADPPAKRVTLGFRDNHTIDNAHDIDWIRFTVPSAQTVRLRTASLVPADTVSDIDLYVLTVPGGGASTDLVRVGSDTTV